MHKIIYASPSKIDWDAQSAFKITNYYTDKEEHMVFCYLKQYVNNGDLKICTYCFEKEAAGKTDLKLCFNLNPIANSASVHMSFGIDGIDSISFINEDGSTCPVNIEDILYSSFRSNDQQGFYWCGEITLTKDFIKRYFDTCLDEKSIILLNFYRTFSDCSDYASLFPDNMNSIVSNTQSMQEFVVLRY